MVTFTELPSEVIFRILIQLDIPELLQVSRTCHKLRALARDPQLHTHRIHSAANLVDVALANRPSRATISPPNAWIWLSKTNVLSRQISKSLIRIRLTHSLEHRPAPEDLVARAILPSICTCYFSLVSPVLIQSQQAVERQKLKTGLGKKLERRPSMTSLVSLNIIPEECAKQAVSPFLVVTRRRIMRERLKDGLRAWVEGHALQAQKRKADEIDAEERSSVKTLVRKFAAQKLARDMEHSHSQLDSEKKREQMKWGRDAEKARKKEEKKARLFGIYSQPTRAHVLGLKRFWEGVTRAAAG